ncbi:MAG: TolC family protein, partial [Candidatus Omnitrophota bacterium]
MKMTKGLNISKAAFALLVSFYIFTPLATAEENGTSTIELSVPTAISMAFEASEDLKISENEVLRNISKQKEERSYARPSVIGQAGWSNNFEYPDIVTTAATREYYVDSGVTLSQTLFTFGRISNAVSAAKKAVDASRFNKESTEQDIIYNTKFCYFNTLLTKRILEISEESYENAKQNKKILEDRSAQGRVSKYDNIKISADISSRLPTVNNARANFISTLETLKVAIGAAAGDDIELVDGFVQEFPEFDREALALALYNNQPAIKALVETIKEKEASIKSKKATLFPEISSFATWNHKGDGDDYYIGKDNMDDYGVAGIKVSIPVWAGGMDREKLRQAKLDKEDAELQYAKGQEEYLLLLDKSISEYREYLKTLEANEEAVRLAEEAFLYSQELFG